MKVIIGLSGGVDSSVAAALLKEQGYDVEAIFMRNWSDESEQCQLNKDQDDATAIAEKLGIKLHIRDLSQEYWDYVFANFINEIKKGRTPNPDILCNKHIKFDAFVQEAKKIGGTHVATGHYARSHDNKLYQPKDTIKDQTYFLWAIQKNILTSVIFPLGSLTKDEVRAKARELNLITSDKKDSVGICFIGPKNYRTFLSKYIISKPGDIITTNGKKIGEHSGLGFYTLGQRSGLHLGGQTGYAEKPWYVVEKRLDERLLVVSQDHNDPLLMSKKLTASDLNLLCDDFPSTQLIKCRFRHQQSLQECRASINEKGMVEVNFLAEQRAITPGQSIVFYNNGLCLGGAIID